MRTNNNKLVDFSNKWTFVGSESLVQEAKDKHSDIYLNFSYTNYGGSFLDKVIISYFKEYYPDNIVHERTAWYGENAFVFGEPAKKLYELIGTGNTIQFETKTGTLSANVMAPGNFSILIEGHISHVLPNRFENFYNYVKKYTE